MNNPTPEPENDQPSEAQKTREGIFQKRASRIEARVELFEKVREALAEPKPEAIAPEEKKML